MMQNNLKFLALRSLQFTLQYWKPVSKRDPEVSPVPCNHVANHFLVTSSVTAKRLFRKLKGQDGRESQALLAVWLDMTQAIWVLITSSIRDSSNVQTTLLH